MSEFDISLVGDAEETEIRVSCKLKKDSEYGRLMDYVDALNKARNLRGMKDVDYKFSLPKLIMRGIDTELAELPEHLVKKLKATRKRRKGEDDGSEGETEMAQAAD
jgi:hypothetical protein